MSRVYFLLGIKASTDLNSLPEGYVYLPAPENGNGPTIKKTALEYPYSDVLVEWLGTYTVGGAAWILLLLMPLPLEWSWGCKVYRFFRRVALNFPLRVKGPWSIREFKALFPTVAASILNGEQPKRQIAGDALAVLPLADYRPTDADCMGDVEPAPATVFAEV